MGATLELKTMTSTQKKSFFNTSPESPANSQGPLSDRDRWNNKYLASASSAAQEAPDEFLTRAFSQYVVPVFPRGGSVLDLAGGAGPNAIWLAKQGWEVTLMDISDVGIERARQRAGPLGSHIHFVVDDLTHFQASQIRFDLVIVFFFLERHIFAEIVKSLRPGGFLIYKTLINKILLDKTRMTRNLEEGKRAMNPAYLLKPGELPGLVEGLTVLHYREDGDGEAVAELVARKEG
jgi:2-polyprenyl-3-methyl-5-hydroxy-6-metoxy-1,4-benzoquinol methylase